MSRHECDVGGVPRPGRPKVRRCSCGDWFIYGHGWTGIGLYRWRPMGPWSMWLHRREITAVPSGFLDLTG